MADLSSFNYFEALFHNTVQNAVLLMDKAGGETTRNDRIVAIAIQSQRYFNISSLKSLDKYLVDEITKFFITYNAMSNKKFTPIAYRGPRKAIRLIKNHVTK